MGMRIWLNVKGQPGSGKSKMYMYSRPPNTPSPNTAAHFKVPNKGFVGSISPSRIRAGSGSFPYAVIYTGATKMPHFVIFEATFLYMTPNTADFLIPLLFRQSRVQQYWGGGGDCSMINLIASTQNSSMGAEKHQ